MILAITLVEGAQFYQEGTLLQRILGWAAEIAAASGLTLFAFRRAIRYQSGLDNQLVESQAQSRLQAALIQLGIQLAATHDEAELCQAAVNELQEASGYDSIEIVLVDPANGSRTVYRRYRPEWSPGNLPGSLLGEPAGVGPPPDQSARSLPEWIQPDGEGEKSNRLEISLRAGNEKLGSLRVVKPGPPPSDGEYSMLVSAANLTALFIANARLFEHQRRQRQEAESREAELRRRERSMKLFSEITQTALESQDFSAMLQAIADQLGALYVADGAMIFLWDEARAKARLAAAHGPLRQTARSLLFEPDETAFINTVLRSGQPLFIQNTAASPHIPIPTARRLQARSLAVFPLIADSHRLGAIVIAYQMEHAFNQDEFSVVAQSARQVTLAIARARALETAEHRAHELDALQKATAALLTTLNLESLLGQILDAAISAVPAAERGSLHLVARDTGQLQVRAVQGYTDPRIRVFSPTSGASFTAQAVRERRPLLVEDLHALATAQGVRNAQEMLQAGSTIVAPLLMASETLGAISLDSSYRHAFSQADLRLLVSFAATAATALQNAQLHTEVQKQAITDTLTGLYNRRGFEELGRREVERAVRFERPLSALMFDIDLFKQVNDQHGHAAGDQVLSNLAMRCSTELRQIDLLGRYGGDEFVVLLPETDAESARQVAERLRRSIGNASFLSGTVALRLTLSVGVATLGSQVATLNALVLRADQALYEAKHRGRNRVVVLL